jgi:transposase
MCLRFMFLLTTRLAAWLRLARREETWKTAEILILRHQLAVPQRQQPHCQNLDWADRALLATLLAVIPKGRRRRLRLLVSPETILRWHRDIVRRRWAARSMHGKTGRPATRRNTRALILRLARENPGWGYRRIHGELAGLGVRVAASTVWEILKKAGIDPAPQRTGPAWSLFLRSQAEAILACDFFTAELLDGTQAYVLAAIAHASRRIRILGVTLHPTGDWTAQQARNLLMDLGEQAHRVKFMIRDRGSNFTAAFDAVLADAGIRTVLCNVRTPRMKPRVAYCTSCCVSAPARTRRHRPLGVAAGSRGIPGAGPGAGSVSACCRAGRFSRLLPAFAACRRAVRTRAVAAYDLGPGMIAQPLPGGAGGAGGAAGDDVDAAAGPQRR